MNLMDLLPSFYEGNKTMEELQGVLSGDVSTMINSLHKMVDECFVGTASDTLRRYENIFGISQVVDQFKNTSASGNPVTISNLLTPVTALKLGAVGQTVETGTGDKLPDNPYTLSGTTKITVSDGGSNSQVINLPQTLYSLPDGTADNYDVISGSGTQNVGKTVLDGSEVISVDKVYTNTVKFTVTPSGIASVPSIIADRFTTINNSNSDVEHIAMWTGWNGINVFILKSRLSGWLDTWTNDEKVTAFKAWLSANPVTVLYELAAPQTITGMGQTIPVYHPTTMLSVDAGTINVTLRSLDAKATLQARRSHIKSKMRARGVTTVGVIKNIAESFLNDEGSVEVTENNPEYRFLIKYIEILGLPPNIDGLKAAVDEIKPAHLDYGIYFEDRVPGKLGIAAISKLGITLTLYPWQIHNYENIGTVQTAAAMKSCLSVTVLERG